MHGPKPGWPSIRWHVHIHLMWTNEGFLVAAHLSQTGVVHLVRVDLPDSQAECGPPGPSKTSLLRYAMGNGQHVLIYTVNQLERYWYARNCFIWKEMMDSILYSAPIIQAMVGGNWEDRGTGKVNRCDVLSVPWKWLFSDPIVGFAYNVENVSIYRDAISSLQGHLNTGEIGI